jgi:hypothetical protein
MFIRIVIAVSLAALGVYMAAVAPIVMLFARSMAKFDGHSPSAIGNAILLLAFWVFAAILLAGAWAIWSPRSPD